MGAGASVMSLRNLNEISLYDTHLMPRVDELIERLSPSRFIGTLEAGALSVTG